MLTFFFNDVFPVTFCPNDTIHYVHFRSCTDDHTCYAESTSKADRLRRSQSESEYRLFCARRCVRTMLSANEIDGSSVLATVIVYEKRKTERRDDHSKSVNKNMRCARNSAYNRFVILGDSLFC